MVETTKEPIDKREEEIISAPQLTKKRSKIQATEIKLEKVLKKQEVSDEEEAEEGEGDDEDEENCPDCGESLWDCEGHDDEESEV